MSGGTVSHGENDQFKRNENKNGGCLEAYYGN